MKLHQSHYSYLDPDEAKFITPEIIKAFTGAGQPEEIVEQIKELESSANAKVKQIILERDNALENVQKMKVSK